MQRLRAAQVVGSPLFRLYLPSGVIRYKVLITTSYPSSRLEKKLLTYLQSSPHVTETLCLFGDWDYTVRLEAFDPAVAQDFLKDLRCSFRDSVTSVVILSEAGDLRWRGVLDSDG